MLGREGLPHAERLAEDHEQHAGGCPGSAPEKWPAPDAGSHRRRAAGIVADDGDAVARGGRSIALNPIPNASTKRPPGTGRNQRSNAEEDHERAHPAGSVVTACVSLRLRDQMRELAHRVALPPLEPEELRELLDDDEDRESEDEAVDHRT